MDNPLFHFEREWNNFLEKEELSVKERYFLENLKEDLLSDIRIIKDQEILTNMKKIILETHKIINFFFNLHLLL